MPVWALAYLALHAVFSLAGLADDRAQSRSWLHLGWGALALLCEALLIVAFFHFEVAESIGLTAILLFTVSLSFALRSAALDLWQHRALPEDERAILPAAIVANAVLYAPALTLGWLVVLRSASFGD